VLPAGVGTGAPLQPPGGVGGAGVHPLPGAGGRKEVVFFTGSGLEEPQEEAERYADPPDAVRAVSGAGATAAGDGEGGRAGRVSDLSQAEKEG